MLTFLSEILNVYLLPENIKNDMVQCFQTGEIGAVQSSGKNGYQSSIWLLLGKSAGSMPGKCLISDGFLAAKIIGSWK